MEHEVEVNEKIMEVMNAAWECWSKGIPPSAQAIADMTGIPISTVVYHQGRAIILGVATRPLVDEYRPAFWPTELYDAVREFIDQYMEKRKENETEP